MDDRRILDEKFRLDLAQRLTHIEVTQKLYHDEIKSIVEALHTNLKEIEKAQESLQRTIYGGDDTMGLLHRFRQLATKIATATVIVMGIGAFLLRPIESLFDDWFVKKLGGEKAEEMVQQSTEKRLQLFNRKTGAYEYYIRYEPKRKD